MLRYHGFSDKNSHIIAESLVSANLRGVDSHGVTRLGIYVKRLQMGVVRPNPNIRIIKETDATLLIDGDDGMGHVTGTRAVEIGAKKAQKSGAVMVGVNRSTHFGTGAFFVNKGISQDMIVFAMSNAPSTMAPWGGKTPYLGTNPYAFGVPAGRNKPIIYDMATSVVARGKIIMAAAKGEKIPHGWAIDKDGTSTTDPQAALDGSVLPFAGAKGYAISLMIDIMCGVLTGAGFGSHINNLYGDYDKSQNVGHFFKIININSFMPVDLFKKRVDQMIDEIKSAPKAAGVAEIFLPGEIEFNLEQKRLAEGIVLDVQEYEELKRIGIDCNLKLEDYQ